MNPHTLHFQLTERCNLACPGCYLPERTGPGKSAAEVEDRVFGPLAASGVKFTTLTGGEPLVHPGCAEICAASARHFQETQLVCNGTLLTPDLFFHLADLGVSSFKVSVDALDPEAHDRSRGKAGTFATVMGHLRAIADDPRRAACPAQIGTITIVSPDNVAHLADLARELLGLGLDSVLFQPFHPFGPVYGPDGDTYGPKPGPVVRPEADATFLNLLAEQVAALSDLKAREPARVDNSLEMLAALPEFFTRPGGPRQVCGANRFIFVNSALEARGCLFCEPLGSLSTLSPEELYASAPWRGFQHFRRSCRLCLMGCQYIGKAQRLMELGFDLLKQEEPRKARRVFSASLARAESPGARHGLGKALSDLGDQEAAVALLRQAWEESPRCLAVAVDLAGALRLSGQEDEALALLDLVPARSGYQARACHLRGLVFQGRGDLDRAEAELSRSVQLDTHAYPRADLGDLLRRRGRAAEALPLLEETARLYPDNAHVRHMLGLALQDVKDHARAAESLSASVALDPGKPFSRYDLGVSLMALSRDVEALTHLSRAVDLDGNFPWSRFNLGMVLQRLGRPAEALAHLEAAAALDPGFAWFHWRLANVLAQLGRSVPALAAYDRAVSLKADFARFHLDRAFLLAALGRPAEARASREKALALDPALAEAPASVPLPRTFQE